jgi:hypothetical protein
VHKITTENKSLMFYDNDVLVLGEAYFTEDERHLSEDIEDLHTFGNYVLGAHGFIKAVCIHDVIPFIATQNIG